jgi:DNA-binding NarL/FixJ family response regulator
MNDDKPVVIVAQPGRVRDGLQALLMAIPQIKIVGLANDVESALNIATDCAPDLVLLGIDLQNGGYGTVLGQIRARWPHARCLILADTVQQRRAAQSAGADDVLLRGFATPKLFESVHRLVMES